MARCRFAKWWTWRGKLRRDWQERMRPESFTGIWSKYHPTFQTLSVRGEKQIAVLPFVNVGKDPTSQAFCGGLVETLTSKLSQLEQFQRVLRVVPASEIRREEISSVRQARQLF